MSYLSTGYGTRQTPQTKPIPGREAEMSTNNAGGVTFNIDKWTRLNRWLILGSEGGTYYQGQKDLTSENVTCLRECITEDSIRVVKVLLDISEKGRAPKQDQTLFALAAVAALSPTKEGKRAAEEAVNRICRIGTHLFDFAVFSRQFRGWGRSLKRSVANWYQNRNETALAYQLAKYQSRNGVSHRDMLRLSKPVPQTDSRSFLYRWAVGKHGSEPYAGKGISSQPPPMTFDFKIIDGFEKAKRATSAKEIVSLITDYGLPRECIPGQFLGDPLVWRALFEKMPMTALIRNLGNLSKHGILKDGAWNEVNSAVEKITNPENLKKARIHPLSVLIASRIYSAGQGYKGSGSWAVCSDIVDALDTAFHLSFDNVEPTGKRYAIGVDVSGSMGSAVSGCPFLPCSVAAAALAMVTLRTEPMSLVHGFSTTYVDLGLRKSDSLDAVWNKMRGLPFSGTDCAVPMLWAMQEEIEVDVFLMITDNETWFGNIHPSQALQEYRRKFVPDARLAVLAMTSSRNSIADPNDPGMLDLVGFDTSTPSILSQFASGEL